MKQYLTASVLLCGLSGGAMAQTSSLYVEPVTVAPQTVVDTRLHRDARLAPAVAAMSFTSVLPPEPRTFAVHDLVTIIVRESSEADSTASLETEKDVQFSTEFKQFLDLAELLQLRVQPANVAPNLGVDISHKPEWEGEGSYSRKDRVTSRVTAEIIDVKPNGLLVLEAKKYIRNDKEELEIRLTGTCRKEDVTIDNTVLSTQLKDLHLTKDHKGELRKATKKGLITKVLEGLFSF